MLPARLDYRMLEDGMALNLEELTIQAVHVPGHTLGLVNFLVTAKDGEAFFFSGDSIFINSFGRPDLGGQGQAWAPLVFESIFNRIRNRVPATAWVLPGHYARHSEANEVGTFMMRLEDVYATNPDLSVHVEKDDFIQYVLEHLPFLPPQYVQIKRVNAGLVQPDEQEASELELGKNICALSTAY
jgi:glyoxylase-like metal-dependent hydrolase (beta-lactamase superfamily II)